MDIRFEKSDYWKAVNDKGIIDFAKDNLQFKYGDVNFQEFDKKYPKPFFFVKKKGGDLSAVVWSGAGVAKAVHHLAKAILVGVIARSGDKNYVKAHFFYIARDLQESFGWLATLFDDEYGQYHVQESGFHKSCYDCFLNNLQASQNPPVSSAPQYDSLSESDLDKELLKISALPSTMRKIGYSQLAEAYLRIGCLDKSLETIENISGNKKEKKAVIAKVAKAYLNKGDKEKAIKVIEKLYSETKVKEEFLAQVAEAYYVEGDLEKAVKTIERINSETPKEQVITKVAKAYFKNGDKKNAIKVIEKLYRDVRTKEAFLTVVAEAYCAEDDLEKALKTIEKLYSGRQEKERVIAEIAIAYLNKGDKEKAIKVINKLYSDIRTKEAVFASVAESYYNEGKLGKALGAIKKISRDIQKKERFVEKIAYAYLAKKDKEKAFETIDKLRHNTDWKPPFFVKLAQLYYEENDDFGVITAIKDVSDAALKDKIIRAKGYEFYMNFQMAIMFTRKQIDFSENLARKCFERAKGQFASNNPNGILEEILKTATSESTVQAYLNLRQASSQSSGFRRQNRTRVNPNAQYYETLGLEPTASPDDVRKAYKKLALRWHPDKARREANESEADFEKKSKLYDQKFQVIHQAYTKLTS